MVLFWKVLEALGNRPWPEEIGSYEYAFEGYIPMLWPPPLPVHREISSLRHVLAPSTTLFCLTRDPESSELWTNISDSVRKSNSSPLSCSLQYFTCGSIKVTSTWYGRIMCILSVMFFNKMLIGQAGSIGGSIRQEVEVGL